MTTLNDSFWPDLNELLVDTMVPEKETDFKMEGLDNLQNSRRYNEIIQEVGFALKNESIEDKHYHLIAACNGLCVDIDNEIADIHNFIRDKYSSKFPELESVVHHPIDYARVVKRIGNETDLTLIDLQGLLPSAIIMVVSVIASSIASGNKQPLPDHALKKTMDACDRVLELDSAKKKLLDFVESGMVCIAPNLSAVVGSSVAVKLMGTAGGLLSLAEMPACNIGLLGAKKENLAGFSSSTSSSSRFGYIEQTDIVQRTPPPLRARVCRAVASKSALAARIDRSRGDPMGNKGRDLREVIRNKIEKWQQPPPPKLPKALPLPHDLTKGPKKKRGGLRLRKRIERYALTDVNRKVANRIQFGIAEQTSFGMA